VLSYLSHLSSVEPVEPAHTPDTPFRMPANATRLPLGAHVDYFRHQPHASRESRASAGASARTHTSASLPGSASRSEMDSDGFAVGRDHALPFRGAGTRERDGLAFP
jgi:hypothetical protein